MNFIVRTAIPYSIFFPELLIPAENQPVPVAIVLGWSG